MWAVSPSRGYGMLARQPHGFNQLGRCRGSGRRPRSEIAGRPAWARGRGGRTWCSGVQTLRFGIEASHDDVPPKVGVAAGDHPPLCVTGCAALLGEFPFVVALVFPDVKSVRQRFSPDWAVLAFVCSHERGQVIGEPWSGAGVSVAALPARTGDVNRLRLGSFLPSPVQIAPAALQLLVVGRTR